MSFRGFWTRACEEFRKAPVRVAVLFIAAYRLILSPWMGGHCRFHPSCSEYSLQAYNELGFFKGTFLTLKRIGRCHPLGGYGFDPIPRSSISHSNRQKGEFNVVR